MLKKESKQIDYFDEVLENMAARMINFFLYVFGALIVAVWIGCAHNFPNSEVTDSNPSTATHQEFRKIAEDQSSGIIAQQCEDATVLNQKGDCIRAYGFSADFVEIGSGSFQMGSPKSENGRYKDEHLHTVTISDFEIQSTVVTQAQYFRVMGSNPSKFKRKNYCPNDHVVERDNIDICPNNPVESVSWIDTQNFIEKLNATDTEYSYRLPTEAEWEYSARAGSQTAYSYGDDADSLKKYAWFYNNSDEMTHAAASKPANKWGLFDVHGNVFQWVSDWYGEYPTSDQKDPVGPLSGNERVVRGGSFDDIARRVRSGYRHKISPRYKAKFVGFRLVRTHK